MATKKPSPAKKTAAKKPAASKKPVKRKPAAKAQVKPTAATAVPSQPVFKVVPPIRPQQDQPEWWLNALKYAQQNPAVTFVAIVAAALGLVLLFS